MQATPDVTNDRISAGPALSCAACPVSMKMPVPMTAPTPRAVSWTGPSTRRRRSSPCISSSSCFSGLVAKRWLAIVRGLYPADCRYLVEVFAHACTRIAGAQQVGDDCHRRRAGAKHVLRAVERDAADGDNIHAPRSRPRGRLCHKRQTDRVVSGVLRAGAEHRSDGDVVDRLLQRGVELL